MGSHVHRLSQLMRLEGLIEIRLRAELFRGLPCIECGHTAVYERVPNSLFVSPAEAAYPGRLPDIYA